MESRTPASVRVPPAEHRRDFRRTGIAAAAALLVHAAVLAVLTLSPALQPEPPRVSVDEPIPVELVLDLPSAGPRTPRQVSDLPMTDAKPAASDAPSAAAAAPPDALASAEMPPDAASPAAAPPTLAAAATAPQPAAAPPPSTAAPDVPPPPVASPADVAATAAPAEAATATPAASPPATDALPPGGAPVEIAAAAEAAETVPTDPGSGPLLGAGSDAPPPAAADIRPESPAATTVAAPPPPDPVSPPQSPAAAPSTQVAETPPQPAAAAPAAPAQLALAAPPAVLAPSDPRDAVDEALKGLDCARLSADVDLLGGAITLKGHARSEADKARLAERLRTLPGIRRVDTGGVRILGEPYCRVVAFLDRPDFQKSTEQRGDLMTVGATNQPGLRRMAGGETVALTLSSPEFDSFLYVDHFSADGRVTHLLPSDRPDNRLKADTVFRLGPSGDRGRRSVIGPPYGLDVIVVVATSEALLLRPRPAQEEAAVYLGAIDERIRALRAMGLKLRTEYAYYLVATEPPRAGP